MSCPSLACYLLFLIVNDFIPLLCLCFHHSFIHLLLICSQFCQSRHCWIRIYSRTDLRIGSDCAVPSSFLAACIVCREHELPVHERGAFLSNPYPRLSLCVGYSTSWSRYLYDCTLLISICLSIVFSHSLIVVCVFGEDTSSHILTPQCPQIFDFYINCYLTHCAICN